MDKDRADLLLQQH